MIMIWVTLNAYNLNRCDGEDHWRIVMIEMSKRIEKKHGQSLKENGEETEKRNWFAGCWVQRIVISHALELHTNDDIIISPPEVKERVDVDSLGEDHRKPNTGKSLSLHIIRQITSAGPALSGYTPKSHGLKMKLKSRPPLLLDVSTLPLLKLLCTVVAYTDLWGLLQYLCRDGKQARLASPQTPQQGWHSASLCKLCVVLLSHGKLIGFFQFHIG